MRFKRLDLNLLAGLDALLTERSFTRAARHLNLSLSTAAGAIAAWSPAVDLNNTCTVFDGTSGGSSYRGLVIASYNGASNIAIEGLWGLAFGNGVKDQPVNTLYYTAGPGSGTHGAYGRIEMK